MKTITIVGFCLIFLLGIKVKAQNPLWIIAPSYSKISTFNFPFLPSSSLQQPYVAYDKAPAQYASNAVADKNGNLLFFIVDGKIYNKDGKFTDELKVNNFDGISGCSEIPIIPDPGNCKRFYIFSSPNYVNWANVSGIPPYPGNPQPPVFDFSIPCYYSIYDLDVPSPTLVSNVNGALTTNGSALTQYTDLGGGLGSFETVDYFSTYYAVSKLKNDANGSFRYIFIFRGRDELDILKLDNQGLHAVNQILIPTETPNTMIDLHPDSRAEMELYEESNGNYRLAFVQKYKAPNTKRVLTTMEVDGNGNLISGSTKYLSLFIYPVGSSFFPNGYDPAIHGLEFSPNGQYIYYTSHYEPLIMGGTQNSIGCWDYQNNIGISLSQIPANDAYSFEQSHIELGTDGKLYFINQNYMATLDNPDNPTASVWIKQYNGLNYNLSNPSNTSDATATYLLPDQIDKENYTQFAPITYDIETPYTANDNLATWTSGNNPWNLNTTDIYMEDSLIIPAGRTLTIQNMTFHFGPDARVIIEQGAKLKLDHATLTNAKFCSDQQDFWQGVEVWGTLNQNQYPTNHPTYQGMLVLTNQSSIENAHVGATNWKVDDWDALGGVIQSYDSKFLNNRRDVAFMTYQNHTPIGTLTGDLSGFTNTDFVSDNNFMEKGLSIEPHISMWQVNNIQFTNCHFANNVSVNKLYSTSPATGIKTINAGFIVRPGCSITLPYGQACPTANLLKSSFSGLKLGIEATSASTSQTVTVEQTDFLDNFNGINIKSINGVSINRNTIELGMSGYNMATIPSGIGIAISNSTGYIVEENNIYGNLRPNSFRGIVVNNSGTDDNRIYKNTVTNMVNGGLALGVNRNAINLQGLQFLCNEINKNESGIFVGRTAKQGIRYYQGENATASTPKIPAGNIFHSNITDISNYASPFVYIYDYNIVASQPTFTPPNSVFLEYFDISRSCPSSFGGTVFLSFARSSMIDSLSGKMGMQKVAYDNLDFTLQSLIDNGNTEQFKDSIVYDWSNDAWELRARLLAASPYVSAPSLLQAAAQSVLPDGMLLEVLLANPDATRGEDFINELKIAAPGFPDYMLDFVRDNWDATTLRTNMESQLSILHTDLTQTRDILRYLRKNQDEYTYTDRFNTVQMGNEIYHKAELMDFYIENQEFAKADSVLNEIAIAKEYAGDLSLIDKYDDYLNFRAGLGTRTIAQLDSSEITQLEILAAGNNRVAEYAQNILCFFYHICYNQIPDLNAPQAKSMSEKQSGSMVNKNDLFYHIKVYPNPAVDYCSIGWEIYDELKDAYYSIYDINGREVMRGEILNNKDEKVIDTRQLRNGIYVIGIYNQNQLKVNKKLVVNR